MNLAALVLMNASIALEDPFDNQGLDGIYIDEPLSECEATINMDEDNELELAVHESLAGAAPAVMTSLTEEADEEQGYASKGRGGHEAVDVHVQAATTAAARLDIEEQSFTGANGGFSNPPGSPGDTPNYASLTPADVYTVVTLQEEEDTACKP
jgi:hypothetical protein